MENIKNNALLYIEHTYNRTYNYYKSIAKTILNLLFGTPYSTGTVDWGALTWYSWNNLGKHITLEPPSGTHPGFLLIEKQV
jgi:hypothetical protein